MERGLVDSERIPDSRGESVNAIYYITREAGYWQRFDEPSPPPSDSELERLASIAKGKGLNTILLGSYHVHAFKMKDGRIWDVINGWRSTRKK